MLQAEIDQETDPVALLPKVVALLLIQVHNCALQAPGRALAVAIAHLKNAIPDDCYGTLLEYHKMTVQLLSMQATAVPGENDCTNDHVRRTKKEALVERMPIVKSIATLIDGNTKPSKS